ncbi:MAG TPA: 50S ribosome-binding GTPase [bacterium]|nr:50S ribosome-binding GTPase [bacterium]
MPANLTPQYKAAEAKFKAARTIEEKIDALEEMYRTIPKHKGTEKMRADIKQRLSKARQQKEQAARSGKKGISFHIPKDGAAQVTLVGPPNSGKSALLNAFTNADADVADYPYTTQRPQPGMMPWENLSIQLVDLPSISDEFCEPWVPSLIRVSDLVLLIVGADNPGGLDIILEILEEYKTELVHTYEDADYHGRIVRLPAILVAMKSDLEDADVGAELLKEAYPDFELIRLSAFNPAGIHMLGRRILEKLNLIRVYTRAPGHDADMTQPIIVRQGSTLMDVAVEIHKDFASDLKFARVWGSGKFDGQRINRDYIVQEGDIFEFKV